ncbi:MAG: phage virion morphogenesis protein [Muribaculaceae bacterium]|nr:phage virion morphogenesis protein [Muribaculaceae bacterium]
MTIQQFEALVKAKQREIRDAIHRRLPVKIGRMATDHFQDNFRRGGYVDGGLHPWPVTRRQQSGGKAANSQYGPLMSARKNLYGSIRYVPGDAQVVVGTSVPYAAVHNQGATITTHPRVTPKMRKFAWRQFFAAGGKNAPADSGAGFWKGLALTKKDKLTVTAKIPQRKFLGQSQELSEKVSQTVENEIKNILNS